MRILIVILLTAAAAVATGNAEAQQQPGMEAYSRGDYAAALSQLRPLAREGDARAEFLLGVMYFHGAGVPQDNAIAAIFFRQAAHKGEPAAQLALGAVYIRGVGVIQDLVQAHYWLSLAAKNGAAGLDEAAALRRATAMLMTPEELRRSERLVASYQPGRTGTVTESP